MTRKAECAWQGAALLFSVALAALAPGTARAQPARPAGKVRIAIAVATDAPCTADQVWEALAIRLPRLARATDPATADAIIDVGPADSAVRVRLAAVATGARIERTIDTHTAVGPAVARLVVLCLADDLAILLAQRAAEPLREPVASRLARAREPAPAQARRLLPYASLGPVLIIQDGGVLTGPWGSVGVALHPGWHAGLMAGLLQTRELGPVLAQLSLRRVPIAVTAGRSFGTVGAVDLALVVSGGAEWVAMRGPATGRSLWLAQAGLGARADWWPWPNLGLELSAGVELYSHRVDFRWAGASFHQTGLLRGRLLASIAWRAS